MTSLQTAHVPHDTPPRSGRRKLLIAVTAVVVLLAASAVLCWKMMGRRLPSPTGDPVAVAKFAATPEFDQLPFEQKEPYLRTLRSNIRNLVTAAEDGRLTRDEQIKAVRAGMKTAARIEMKNYFALPEGAARQAHLDKLIDEQQKLGEYASRASRSGSSQFGSGATEMKQFIESLPPEERIRMAQFAYNLFQRRRERGLPVWPYGGPANNPQP